LLLQIRDWWQASLKEGANGSPSGSRPSSRVDRPRPTTSARGGAPPQAASPGRRNRALTPGQAASGNRSQCSWPPTSPVG
jgi:hypothetical protein